MRVLEPGPGMCLFTLDLAHLIGTLGRVVAVDIQAKMIKGLKRRAAKAGLLDRIEVRVASANSMGIGELTSIVGFTLAFAAAPELPNAGRFLVDVSQVRNQSANPWARQRAPRSGPPRGR